MQRSFGLDVHLDFCEVAVCEEGRVSQLGRIASTPEAIGEFASTPRCSRSCWRPGCSTRCGYQTRRRVRCVAASPAVPVWCVRGHGRRTRDHAVLARCLLGRPPVSDLFGKQGRVWLAEQGLPEEEAQTVASCLRHIDFLNGEIAQLDQWIARQALALPGFHRLLTIPGVDVGTAAAVIGAVGDITRLQSPGQLVAYLGLDPRVRQSGSEPARYGHISKRGDPQARAMLVEAAWRAIRTPGPLRAFGERVGAGATPGRASNRPSKGKAARQVTSP